MTLTNTISPKFGSQKILDLFQLTTEEFQTQEAISLIHNFTVKTVTYETQTRSNTFQSISNTWITTPLGRNTTEAVMTPSIVSALMENNDIDDKSAHRIALTILIGIFMFISVVISVAIIVFCKKKNSVFMFQKSEQDSELEMDDINTEVETSDSEYETIDSPKHIINAKAETYPCLSKYVNEQNTSTVGSILQCNRYNKKGTRNGFTRSPSAMPLLHSSRTGSQREEHKNLLHCQRHSDSQLLSHNSSDHQTGLPSLGLNRRTLQKENDSRTSQRQTINTFPKSKSLTFSRNAQYVNSSIENLSRTIPFTHSRVVSLECGNDQHNVAVETREVSYQDTSECALNLTEDEGTLLIDGRLEIL